MKGGRERDIYGGAKAPAREREINRREVSKTKQNKTKQNKTKQNKTKQNKTKQNKTNNYLFYMFRIMNHEGHGDISGRECIARRPRQSQAKDSSSREGEE